MQSCENCGQTIGRLETTFVFNDYVVCKACHDKLSYAAAQASQPVYQPTPGDVNRSRDLITGHLQVMAFDNRMHVAPDIPQKVLDNALRSYMPGVAPNQVVAIADITFRKSGKDGAAFTTRGLYSKMSFEKPKFVRYEDIHEASLKKRLTNDDVLINGEKQFSLDLIDREGTQAFVSSLQAIVYAVHAGHWQT